MKKDLTEVFGIYNQVLNFNAKKRELIAEYEKLDDLFDQIEEKNDNLTVCHKLVNMPITMFGNSGVSKTQIEEIEIFYSLRIYDSIDVGFSLELLLSTRKGVACFSIAATEEDDELIPHLKVNRRNLTIDEEDTNAVKFHSRKDFQEILDLCHGEIKKFNEQALVKLINRLVKT